MPENGGGGKGGDQGQVPGSGTGPGRGEGEDSECSLGRTYDSSGNYFATTVLVSWIGWSVKVVLRFRPASLAFPPRNEQEYTDRKVKERNRTAPNPME